MSESTEALYKILFHNEGKVYELFAREVGQGGLFGFIEVADLVFGTRTEVVIDPGEDALRTEFEGVERLHIPMHSVIRIDEVRKQGTARIHQPDPDAGEAKVATFPVPIYTAPPNES